MASSNFQKNKKTNTTKPSELYIDNYLQVVKADDDSIISVVDTRFTICETGDCCNMYEVCEASSPEDPLNGIVQFGDSYFYQVRLKGLTEDEFDQQDPGNFINLSCSPEQTGIRVRGDDIVSALEGVSETETIAKFCEWLLENIFEKPQVIELVCEIFASSCLTNPSFLESLCEWFVGVILEDPICKPQLIEFILTDEILKRKFCLIWLDCLDNADLFEAICSLLLEVLSDQEVRDYLCQLLASELSDLDSEISARVCALLGDFGVATLWDSSASAPPLGDPAATSYLVDQFTGCVTAVCVGGAWICVESLSLPVVSKILLDRNFSCPLSFPVWYNGTKYDNGAGLASDFASAYSCEVTFSATECALVFDPDCALIPYNIIVSSQG